MRKIVFILSVVLFFAGGQTVKAQKSASDQAAAIANNLTAKWHLKGSQTFQIKNAAQEYLKGLVAAGSIRSEAGRKKALLHSAALFQKKAHHRLTKPQAKLFDKWLLNARKDHLNWAKKTVAKQRR